MPPDSSRLTSALLDWKRASAENKSASAVFYKTALADLVGFTAVRKMLQRLEGDLDSRLKNTRTADAVDIANATPEGRCDASQG